MQKLAQLSSYAPPVLKMQLMIKVTTRLMAFLPLLNQALTIVGQARLAQFGQLRAAAAGNGLCKQAGPLIIKTCRSMRP